MSGPIINLHGVGKIYPRVHHPWERMRAFAALLAGREPRLGAQVLSDIDLTVRRGDTVGIIGENGAGKSTLLKVLTGVISPSTGRVEVNASVAALLELGAGFQPEFSGYDNVRMKAALLGMSTVDLDARMDAILAFADIGEYIHEPVKHYSSGMVVRLGFAVVAASDPEVLITDEVLAVGDESFQKKCVRWIEAFLEQGNTLLMVSHSMYLVQKLCKRALWLHQGRLRQAGDVFEVTQAYLAWHETRAAQEKELREATTGESGHYRVVEFRLLNQPSTSSFVMACGSDLDIEMIIQAPDGRKPVAVFGIVRADGTSVYGLASDAENVVPEEVSPGLFGFRLKFSQLSLLPGSYSVRGHALDPEGMRMCDTAEHSFTVTGESWELGLVRLAHEWLPASNRDV